MKLSGDFQLLKREDLSDAPKGEYIDRLVLALNTNAQTLRTGVESVSNPIYTDPLKLTHGVELRIKNPLGVALPKAVIAVNSDGFPVQTLSWRRINSQTQPDQLGITVQYAQPVGEDLTVALTGSISLPTGTLISIVWSGVAGTATPSKPGNVLSWDTAAGIVLRKAGLYRVTFGVLFTNNATGNRFASINSTVGGELARFDYLTNTAGSNLSSGMSVELVSLGNETLYAQVVQNSSVSLNIYGTGTLATRAGFGARTFMQVSRIRNDETPTANVTLKIEGGS